jgi:nucleoside-diphosphate-sugar epimerase
MLLDEIAAGRITALIARSADFYGPHARTSIANILVFDKLAQRATAAWFVNDQVPHSFTFTPDAARAIALLAGRDDTWDQTWHLPTAAHPPTGKAFVHLAAAAFGTEPKLRVLRRPILRLVGCLNSDVRATYEMLYQYDSPYVFDSGKFSRACGVPPTPYRAGITQARASYADPG